MPDEGDYQDHHPISGTTTHTTPYRTFAPNQDRQIAYAHALAALALVQYTMGKSTSANLLTSKAEDILKKVEPYV